MPLYQYIKEVPKQKRAKKQQSWVLSLFLMGSGLGLLAWVIWPILSFIVVSSDQYVSALVSPVQTGDIVVSSTFAGTVLAVSEDTEQTSGLDYTNADAWFPTKPQKKIIFPTTRYRLS